MNIQYSYSIQYEYYIHQRRKSIYYIPSIRQFLIVFRYLVLESKFRIIYSSPATKYFFAFRVSESSVNKRQYVSGRHLHCCALF